MTTRKINKRFRKTRSKRQKGGNQEEKDNFLFDAIDMNETDKVETALKNGADVNAKDNDGSAALIKASLDGHTEVVAMLLNYGADVNAKTDGDYTALMKAVLYGHTEIVRILLDKGSDVNTKTIYGSTILGLAWLNTNTEIMAMLLEKGADVNASERNDTTVLMKASKRGQTEIVSMLLKNGADVNAKDQDGGTALIGASEKGHTEIVRILLDKGADVNAKDNNEFMAIEWAVEFGHTSVVELLEKAIKTQQITRDNKQKAMELVTSRNEKVPSLQTMAHRNIDTHAIMLYNNAVKDGTVPPPGRGGKRKTRKSKRKNRKTRSKRQRGGNINEKTGVIEPYSGGKIKTNGGGGIFSAPVEQNTNNDKESIKIDSIIKTVGFNPNVRKRKPYEDLDDNTSDNSEEGDLSGTFKKKKENTKNRSKSAKLRQIKYANKNTLTALKRKTEKAHNDNDDNFLIKKIIDRNEWNRRKIEINNRTFIAGTRNRDK
jgi:ankyrin repeat protein